MPAESERDGDWEQARLRMVAEDIRGGGITNERVISAMAGVPRHRFVPVAERQSAYYDMALPIGEGQTISPPFVVAYMTEQLDPQPTDRVLEVGTGSGYQSAVLSGLVSEVYTIEIVEPLGKRAADTLAELGYKNIYTRVGDGFAGWPEAAPFNKIVVTCSPEEIPRPLVEQLAEGGRLVIPVGERFQQALYLYEKIDGELKKKPLEPTMFVPMLGRAEDQRRVKPLPHGVQLVNGGFESDERFAGIPDGWYYVRQARLVPDRGGRNRALEFSNLTPGRHAQVLQAFGVYGESVARLEVSCRVSCRDVAAGRDPHQLPRLEIAFHGADRSVVGQAELGPWSDTIDWTRERMEVDVPADARLAVLAIGLFGATGEASFDEVRVRALPVNQSALPRRPTFRKPSPKSPRP